MNKVIKVKDYKQKPKGACPAETEADRELQPKLTTSSPACSNTFVMCRILFACKVCVQSKQLQLRLLCSKSVRQNRLFFQLSS